ncbi:MFS transporter [Falsiroseomonas sp. E2-1-a20]|uniref:MFS transporter n=1 Tax=Falsiroseomonas sp. E2-1-a20 TaxID=3239300 RepID=UPI003F3EB96A
MSRRALAQPAVDSVPAPVRPDLARWRVVAGAFLVLLAGYGAIYSYAAFAEPIADEFGTGRANLTLVFAISGASCFFVSPLSGPLADRIGARVPALAGMLLVGLGLLVAASARSLVEVHAGYGLLIGLGTGFAYVPAMAGVQARFRRHRGLASGIAVSGIGVGTALVPPAAEALLALGDWRLAFVVLAIVLSGIGLVGAALLDGAPLEALAVQLRPAEAPPGAARSFMPIWFGVVLVSLPSTLPHALLVGTARDLGLPRDAALGLLGLLGLGTIAGRFLLAALADAVGRARVFLACCAAMSASLGLWALAPGLPGLQAFALLFGALQGGFVALLPAFAADGFGSRDLGALLGRLYTARGVALLLAPPTLAFAIDAAGQRAAPLLAAALVGLVGAALLAAARPRPPHISA